MQIKGPEYGCPAPVFPNVDLKAEPEQGGIAVGWHEGNPSDPETGLINSEAQSRPVTSYVERYRARLEAMSPHEARQYEERMRRLTELYQGPGGP